MINYVDVFEEWGRGEGGGETVKVRETVVCACVLERTSVCV